MVWMAPAHGVWAPGCRRYRSVARAKEPPVMEISTIGLDLAKNVFQVHAVDASGNVVIRRAIRRSQVLPADAEREGRVCEFPVEPSLPVECAWDLGIGDSTAIWFFQAVGGEIRV